LSLSIFTRFVLVAGLITSHIAFSQEVDLGVHGSQCFRIGGVPTVTAPDEDGCVVHGCSAGGPTHRVCNREEKESDHEFDLAVHSSQCFRAEGVPTVTAPDEDGCVVHGCSAGGPTHRVCNPLSKSTEEEGTNVSLSWMGNQRVVRIETDPSEQGYIETCSRAGGFISRIPLEGERRTEVNVREGVVQATIESCEYMICALDSGVSAIAGRRICINTVVENEQTNSGAGRAISCVRGDDEHTIICGDETYSKTCEDQANNELDISVQPAKTSGSRNVQPGARVIVSP
tara:strand:+ start:9313 stop:10173 length:861 start_codon:yes stop_codon:yes gene_type:complete